MHPKYFAMAKLINGIRSSSVLVRLSFDGTADSVFMNSRSNRKLSIAKQNFSCLVKQILKMLDLLSEELTRKAKSRLGNRMAHLPFLKKASHLQLIYIKDEIVNKELDHWGNLVKSIKVQPISS